MLALRLVLHRAARPSTPPLTAIRESLARAERLAPPPSQPAPEPKMGQLIVLRPPSVPPPPPPVTARYRTVPFPTAPENGKIIQEINGCKMLLLEIIRRTAYDWVLYRTSRRMVQKVLAEEAYRWLFLEVPGSPEWDERKRECKDMTSFEAICESLDLDPDTVREHIRKLTPNNVMSVGRPAEYRRRDVFTAQEGGEDVYAVPDNMLPYSEASDDEPVY
jgi:hypothetical protein